MTEASKKDKVTKMTVKPANHVDPIHWCDAGTVAQTVHDFDPKLTMMLSAVRFLAIKLLK